MDEMNIEKLDLASPDLVQENIEKIAALFPNCVTEGPDGKSIDFDLLKQELSYAVVDGTKERYRLEWPGKKEAIVTANIPTTKTLRPVREDSVDFDNTENLYIEGDNLEVLKLLQESYLGKIKMIYIDPPYNTGNDFIYKDNLKKEEQAELFDSGQKDEYGRRLVPNPNSSGRYHSDWLSMIYPRLKLARNLLLQDGLIFISIDEIELSNLKLMCDEIFGQPNFVEQIAWKNKYGSGALTKGFANVHEYILVYSKTPINDIAAPLDDTQRSSYKQKDEKYDIRGGYITQPLATNSKDDRPNLQYPIYHKGVKILPEKQWIWSEQRFLEAYEKNEIVINEKNGKYSVRLKQYLKDEKGKERLGKPISILNGPFNQEGTKEIKTLFGTSVFDFPKPSSLLKYLFSFVINNNEDLDFIVLDFFAGSSGSADALMQLNSLDNGNRKFIQIQLPEVTHLGSEAYKLGYKNICEIGKERIRRAGKSIIEGLKTKEQKLTIQLKEVKSQLEKLSVQLSVVTDLKVDELKQQQDTLQQELQNIQTKICNLDKGFRVFRVDSSNMQDVYYKPQDYKQSQLDAFADNVKPDRTADDLLAQVMLDWGLPLSLKIEKAVVAGKEVFKVAGNSLYACFDKGIDEEFAKEIAKDAPLRIVFRDSGFKDDTAKINVKQLLKQLSSETEMKVI